MPMTMGEAVSRIRDRLEEAEASLFSDTMLRKWVNEGAKDLARWTEAIEDKATIAVTAGVPEVAGPADSVKVTSITFTPDGISRDYPLEYVDVDVATGIYYTGSTSHVPERFTLWQPAPNMAIRLYPNPTSAGQLTVWYRRLPAELDPADPDSDTEPLDFPEAWIELLLDFAEARALRRDRDPRWNESWSLYQAARAEMLIRTQRHADQPGAIYGAGAHSAIAALDNYGGW